MSTFENTTPFNGVASSTIVRATIVQASTVYNDTPATLGNQSIIFHDFHVLAMSNFYVTFYLIFAEKAKKYIVEAANNGSKLVVFPEAFIGGYPRGFRFGLAVGVFNEEGRDEFRKYHASAIHVPGITSLDSLFIFLFSILCINWFFFYITFNN